MAKEDTDDIFREVEEEIRKERFEKLWETYGTYIAGAAVAFVLLVGGWKFYEYRQAKAAAEAGARFNTAMLSLEAKKSEDADKVLRQISQGGPGGYRALARMRLAGNDHETGKTEEAVKAFDAIAGDRGVDEVLRGLASIRAAMLRIDSADWTEMQNRLTPLKDAKNPWHASARELLGLAAWQAGKYAEAEVEFQGLVEARNTPQGIKQRAEMMLALLLDAAKAAPGTAGETAAKEKPQGAANEKAQPATPAKSGGAKGAPK